MSRIFDPKVFQLGYVGLGCTDLEKTATHYQSILGLSETAKGHDKEVYLSVGYEHHNVVLKKTDQKSLLNLGYQLKPSIEIANFAKGLRDLGLRPETKSDSQPGIASLIEVEVVPGHVLQFYSHIDSPAPGFKEGGVRAPAPWARRGDQPRGRQAATVLRGLPWLLVHRRVRRHRDVSDMQPRSPRDQLCACPRVRGFIISPSN